MSLSVWGCGGGERTMRRTGIGRKTLNSGFNMLNFILFGCHYPKWPWAKKKKKKMSFFKSPEVKILLNWVHFISFSSLDFEIEFYETTYGERSNFSLPLRWELLHSPISLNRTPSVNWKFHWCWKWKLFWLTAGFVSTLGSLLRSSGMNF